MITAETDWYWLRDGGVVTVAAVGAAEEIKPTSVVGGSGLCTVFIPVVRTAEVVGAGLGALL